MQLTLDLIIPKEDVAKTANYQHPLKNFRDLAIANGSIFKEDDMGALRQFCRKHGLNQAGWRFLNRYGKSAYAALFSMVDDIDCIFEIALCYINWVRDKQPAFDRNQWRSGWGAIRRNYQKWQRLNPEPGAWHSLLPAFEQVRFIAVTNGVLRPRTEAERIWLKYRRLGYKSVCSKNP